MAWNRTFLCRYTSPSWRAHCFHHILNKQTPNQTPPKAEEPLPYTASFLEVQALMFKFKAYSTWLLAYWKSNDRTVVSLRRKGIWLVAKRGIRGTCEALIIYCGFGCGYKSIHCENSSSWTLQVFVFEGILQ